MMFSGQFFPGQRIQFGDGDLTHPVLAGGAAPTIVGVGTAATGTSSLSISYPGGLLANDIAFVVVNVTEDGTLGNITDFTGLTQFSTGNLEARLYWKRLTGSESGSVSCSISPAADGATGRMVIVRGAIATGTPYEGYNTAALESGPWNSPSTTTTGPLRLGLRWGGYAHFDPYAATSPPSGWTEVYDNQSNIVYLGATCDSKEIAAAGTEPSSARSVANAYQATIASLAVIPAG